MKDEDYPKKSQVPCAQDQSQPRDTPQDHTAEASKPTLKRKAPVDVPLDTLLARMVAPPVKRPRLTRPDIDKNEALALHLQKTLQEIGLREVRSRES